jgi:hypothetical protein
VTNQPSFVGENAASQQELRAMVASLSDSDLAQDMGGGWTVAAMLAHMAFYDFRAAAAVDRWSHEDHIDPFPIDAQMTNITTTPLLLAIPPRLAAQLALQAAEMADGRMAGLDGALAERIAVAKRSVSLFRSEHRREHIDQIKKALASGQHSAPAAG